MGAAEERPVTVVMFIVWLCQLGCGGSEPAHELVSLGRGMSSRFGEEQTEWTDLFGDPMDHPSLRGPPPLHPPSEYII